MFVLNDLFTTHFSLFKIKMEFLFIRKMYVKKNEDKKVLKLSFLILDLIFPWSAIFCFSLKVFFFFLAAQMQQHISFLLLHLTKKTSALLFISFLSAFFFAFYFIYGPDLGATERSVVKKNGGSTSKECWNGRGN